jgi:hypothetical protein
MLIVAAFSNKTTLDQTHDGIALERRLCPLHSNQHENMDTPRTMTRLGRHIHHQNRYQNPVTIISECDRELISSVQTSGRLSKYAYMGWCSLQRSWGQTHSFRTGRRSQNRNKSDELAKSAWVSKSFNSWNCVRTDKRPSTSRFKVSKKGTDQSGMLAELTTHAGYFHRREAAIAAATTLRAGELAGPATLPRIGRLEALLSPAEMRVIVTTIVLEKQFPSTASPSLRRKGSKRKMVGFKAQYRKEMALGPLAESAGRFRRDSCGLVQEAGSRPMSVEPRGRGWRCGDHSLSDEQRDTASGPPLLAQTQPDKELESELSGSCALLKDHASHSRDAVGRLNTFEPTTHPSITSNRHQAGQPGVHLRGSNREQQRNQVKRPGT